MSYTTYKKILDTISVRSLSYGSFLNNAYNYYKIQWNIRNEEIINLDKGYILYEFYISCISSKLLRLINLNNIEKKSIYNIETLRDTYIDMCGYTMIYANEIMPDLINYESTNIKKLKFTIDDIIKDIKKLPNNLSSFQSVINKCITNHDLIV